MKRDYNVMRLILHQVRDETPPPDLQNYDERLITYNSALLVKDNYADGEVIEDGTGNYASVVLLHLTTKGHDLLERLEAEYVANVEIKPSMTTKRQFSVIVFISHSGKDEKLAEALVALLRNALNIPANEIRCTSVNGSRLPAGAPTDEELRREVHESKAFIGLITPSSMASAYVMFELGARWGAGLHLVPLLGAGADTSYLRGPLSALNALNCEDAAQVHQLVDDLAKLLGIGERTPTAAYQTYLDRLIGASKPSGGAVTAKSTKPEVGSQVRDQQLSVVLSPVPGDILKSHRYRIEIHNKSLISVNNVKVTILGMQPIPRGFSNPQFPISLPAVGGDRTVNPGAKGYFDFAEIVCEPKLRRVTFTDDVGHTQSFEETMSDMLRSATEREYSREYSSSHGLAPSADGYFLEIQVSALDRVAIKKSIRLKLIATREDELGFTPIGGVIISLV